MGLRLIELEKDFPCYASGEMEARFIYAEIFEDDNYELPGLPEAPHIVDVGANIGLYSLYMKRRYPKATIVAVEPAPENVEALRRNLELHCVEGVTVYPVCLGAVEKEVPLTYYPQLPGNSTLYPGGKRLQQQLMGERLGHDTATDLFAASTVQVAMKRLSTILQDTPGDLSPIDLLKVDVEGAELDVLGGIEPADWQRVRNVQMEVADFDGQMEQVERLLTEHGFAVTSAPVHFMWEELRLFYVTASQVDQKS